MIPLPITDPVESARAAGLHYVTDTRPGIRRKRAGKAFSYVGPDGQIIRDKAVLERIRALVIPPAWADVWICPDPCGHLQATGRDGRGRKQYRYHPRWRQVRDETKYSRMIAFGETLPEIRRRVEADLGRPGLPREKVLATVVRLLETTHIRIGNEEYAQANDSYGLTTLRNQHVAVSGTRLRFQFRGKSGKEHEITISDRRLARIVKRCQDLPGQELFAYIDDDGQPQTIDSTDVNAYLHDISGQEFTAKDFRTWAGTVLAVLALQTCEVSDTATGIKKNLAQAVKQVAAELGNTPAVCRKAYIHPAILECYQSGSLLSTLIELAADQPTDIPAASLRPDEALVLAFLRWQAAGERAVAA